MIIFLGNTVGSQICFFGVRFILRELIERKYGKLSIFRAIKHEINDAPWTASIMLSALFIPNSIKNYSIPLTNITYIQFALPNTVFFALYASLMVNTGHTLKSVESLFEKGKAGGKNTATASTGTFWVVVSWLTLVLTIVLITVAGCRLYKRIQSFNDSDQSQKTTELIDLELNQGEVSSGDDSHIKIKEIEISVEDQA